MIREAIAKVVDGQNLTEADAKAVMTEIMEGQATPAQIAGFITALRIKGETTEEITGCAQTMREHATAIRPRCGSEAIVDTCGTGGDQSSTFNISTAAALITAGAGLPVAKHGNRAVSSKCGSADVLKTLGVNLEIPPQKVEECIDKVGIGFLFAPLLHGAMKHAIGPRREIGIRTVFNILGPLTNPAGAKAQVLGVYDAKLTSVMANVLKNLGSKQAFVVHGKDGMDEISISGETQVSELADNKVNTYDIKPEDFALKRAKPQDIQGDDAETNAGIVRKILNGEQGPCRDIACLNAAAAIAAGGKAKDIAQGLKLAFESIDSGKATEKLQGLIEVTNAS